MKLRICLIAIACAAATAALGMGSAQAATINYCIDGATVDVSNDTFFNQAQLEIYASLGGAYTFKVGTGPDAASFLDALGTLDYFVGPFSIPGGVFHPILSGACSAGTTTPPADPGATTAAAGSVPLAAGGIFLCYSKYQTDPGVWDATQATELLAAGYWKPVAVAGFGSATRFGPFSLVCNPGKQAASAPSVGVDSSGTIYTQPPSRLQFLDTYDFAG